MLEVPVLPVMRGPRMRDIEETEDGYIVYGVEVEPRKVPRWLAWLTGKG